jgi:hypothetical protein
MSPAVLAALGAILGELAAGILTAAEAVAALLEVGIVYTGAVGVTQIVSFINGLISSSGGGSVAVAPVGNILNTPPACSSKTGHKGICCAAVTQLGLAQAAAGFRYTSCTGKQVCLACGTKASTSTNPAKAGKTVFAVKRVSCGVNGCPALSQLQGQIISPA